MDEAALTTKNNEATLVSVHDTLESVLRDTFKIEDGARLSSLQSYLAGQTPLESLLDEFRQLVEQLDLSKNDVKVLQSLEKLWSEVCERF